MKHIGVRFNMGEDSEFLLDYKLAEESSLRHYAVLEGSLFIPLLQRIYEMLDHTVIIGDIIQQMEVIHQHTVTQSLMLEHDIIAKNRQLLAYLITLEFWTWFNTNRYETADNLKALSDQHKATMQNIKQSITNASKVYLFYFFLPIDALWCCADTIISVMSAFQTLLSN